MGQRLTVQVPAHSVCALSALPMITPQCTAGFGTSEIWNGEIWCRENLTPILKYLLKFGTKFPDCGTRRSIDGGCLDGSSHFLEASGCLLLGTMEMRLPKALNMTPGKVASDLQIPSHNLAHFGCQILPFHISPVPDFPSPVAPYLRPCVPPVYPVGLPLQPLHACLVRSPCVT